MLLETLAVGPVIAKLDLRENDISNEVCSFYCAIIVLIVCLVTGCKLFGSAAERANAIGTEIQSG